MGNSNLHTICCQMTCIFCPCPLWFLGTCYASSYCCVVLSCVDTMWQCWMLFSNYLHLASGLCPLSAWCRLDCKFVLISISGSSNKFQMINWLIRLLGNWHIFVHWHLKVIFELFNPGLEFMVKVMVLVSGQSGCVESTFYEGLTIIGKPGTNTFVIGRHDYADVWTK